VNSKTEARVRETQLSFGPRKVVCSCGLASFVFESVNAEHNWQKVELIMVPSPYVLYKIHK
jgi:hypothetical protein